MKRLLTVAALLLTAPMLRADKTVTALLNARTTIGSSSAIYSTTVTANGGEHWFFQAHVVGGATARLELSCDGGTTWTNVHAFLSPDDMSIQPETGGGRWRVTVINAPTGSSVSVYVAQSGTLVPTVTP